MPVRSKTRRNGDGNGEPSYRGAPNVSQILKRVRTMRKLSIREVAEGSGLSASFLSALERGESDVSIGRLAQIAEFFDMDLGSMLGYSTMLSQPTFIGKSGRVLINRGKGVRYEVLRLTGLNLELIVSEFEPRTAFRDALTHEGVDTLYVLSGEIVLVVNGVDYPMRAGECAVFSAGFSHTMRNDSSRAAKVIAVTTAHM